MLSFEFRAAIVVVIAILAVIFDLRSRRIPNWLTLGAAAAALIYALATGGFVGLRQAVLAWTVGAAIFFPLFALRGMGAGDVKLIAGLAAWLGDIAHERGLATGVPRLAFAIPIAIGLVCTLWRH